MLLFPAFLIVVALAAVVFASVFKKPEKKVEGGVPLVDKYSVEAMDADLLGVLKSCKNVRAKHCGSRERAVLIVPLEIPNNSTL